MNVNEVYWVAGLLEGEGCFSLRGRGHNPIISLAMTDADIVIRAARILGAHKVTREKTLTKAGKFVYRTIVYGSRAIQWIMTLYTLMGTRRREAMAKCIEAWKSKPAYLSGGDKRSFTHPGTVVMWARVCEEGITNRG